MADSAIGKARIFAARFDDRASAEVVSTELVLLGYDPAEFSYISDPEKCAFVLDAPGGHVVKTAAGAMLAGAVFGGGTGAVTGALGAGSILLLGPVGLTVGLGVGGIIGILLGFGVNSDQAEACEAAVRAGSLVMTVQAHSGDEDRIARALAHHVIATEDDTYF